MFKELVFVFSVLSGLVVFPVQKSHSDDFGNITGIITDSVTGEKIENALVILTGSGLCDTTDREGKFGFYNLMPGNYQISIFHFKYNLDEISGLDIKPSESIILNRKLTLSVGFTLGKILWNVTDYENKRRITRANIEIMGTGFSKTFSHIYDNVIRDIPPGTYTIRISLDKNNAYYSAEIDNVEIKAGETTNLKREIICRELYRYGQIEGVITDSETGEPLINVSLYFNDSKCRGFSDENGNFVISKVKPGNYVLRMSHISYESKEIAGVEVNEDSIVLVSVEMSKLARGGISGRITDFKTSLPIEGVDVYCQGIFGKKQTDSEGRYEFVNILFGTYSLLFVHEDYDSLEYPGVLVNNGVIEDVSISLLPRNPEGLGEISGCVIDSLAGEPLSGVMVSVTGTRINRETDESGEFIIKYLVPGVYTVSFGRYSYATEVIAGIVVEADSFTSINVKLHKWRPGDKIFRGEPRF
jgi:hypothetical protein